MLSIITEYDEEKHIRNEKRESLEEGIAIGMEKGLEALSSLVDDGILTIDEAAERLGMTTEDFSVMLRAGTPK